MSTIGSFDWRDESEDHLLFGDSDKDFFFEEGGREHYIEQLATLCEQDELFVFLLGATGIGKTSILHEFIRRYRDAADCVYIEVPILADAISLLDNIAKQCEISIHDTDDVDHYIHSIREFIQNAQLNERQFILSVDDADGLPDDALKALLKLIGKSCAPHFIFASHDPSLQSRIGTLIPFYQTRTIEVAPLTETESASYVELYLSAYDIENNFSDDDIYDMFLSSGGNIGEINKLISTTVDNRLQADNIDYLARTQKMSTLQVPRLHIVAVVTAIIGLGVLGLYFMSHTTTKTTTVTHEASSSVAAGSVSEISKSGDGLTVETKTVPASKETQPPSETVKIASAQQGQVITESKATAAPTQPVATKEPSAVPTSAPAKTTTSNWLATAPDDHFTLQMMGSYSKDSVTKLIKGQSNQKNWAIYQTKREGKPWFVAVYGNYASKKAAQEAAAKLPVGLREGKPWPKAISAIHKEMKQ